MNSPSAGSFPSQARGSPGVQRFPLSGGLAVAFFLVAVLDNPAGRYYVLTEIKSRARGQARMEGVLSEILGVDQSQHGERLSRTADILKLPAQIEEAVGRLSFDGSELIRELPSISRELNTLSNVGAAEGWVKRLKPGAMSELRICSSILHQFQPEWDMEPKEEDLADLAEKVASLLSDVRRSDLPEDLRNFLKDRLGEIQRAVDMYPVVGLADLERAFERSLGGFRDSTRWERLGPFRKRFFNILKVIHVIVGIGAGTVVMLEALEQETPPAIEQHREIVDGEIIEDDPEPGPSSEDPSDR